MVRSMYCPVDGIEWREGITRCPEHDVDLVDEPPEEEPSFLDRADAWGLGEIAVRVISVAAIFYALSGAVLAGWYALASSRDWTETGVIQALGFTQSASSAVAVGALGCLVAGVLGRTWTRLGPGGERPAPVEAPEEEADEAVPEGAGPWVITLLSSLVIVFAVLWAVTGIAISWEEADFQFDPLYAPGGVQGPSETIVNLAALHNVAYTCALAALASLGALILARVYDRLTGLR
jgi:hypothetical protein